MASLLWDPAREGFLLSEIDWDGAVIKAALVRGYTFNAAHKFVSDVTGAGGTLVSTSPALTSKTGTAGVAGCAPIVWSSVPTGAAIPVFIVFQASSITGGADVAATQQRLIAFVDTATGLPVTPNGQNITFTPDAGANKLFKL